MIGLMGSHRVGKTSLAQAYAKENGIEFVETSVSGVFKELGLDPAASFGFRERLTIQEIVLTRIDAIYGSLQPGGQYIADRTPLDMLAYTMAEAIGESVSDADQARFAAYTQKCFDVTNKRFSTLILVQPGIPLVYEPGKAALNVAYIEHLNSLMLGLSVDERVKSPHFYLPRNMTDMDARVRSLESACMRANFRDLQECRSHVAQGGYLM